MHSPVRSTVQVTLVLLATGACTLAGPLDPPAGPITSTAKPLGEVEPRIAINAVNTPGDANSVYRVEFPGSYYLTGNLVGATGKRGIEIAASGVSIDLNGFELIGVSGSLEGIVVEGFQSDNVEVRNGTVRNWGSHGVDYAVGGSGGSVVRDVRAGFNGGDGIRASNGNVVTGCAAYRNTGSGFSLFFGCAVSACTSYQNTGSGYASSTGCTIAGCIAQSNTADGMTLSGASAVVGCSLSSNGANGILATTGSTIMNNTVRSCGLDGIRVTGSCNIIGNVCNNNGTDPASGAGIHASSGDNRIEGNTCTGQDRGIDIDAAGNFIVRNVCSGNTTNWDVVANNVFGPIVDRSSPGSAAVIGNSAPSSLASTDANANFTY
jgi:parallel beta-helix repeat protein